MFMPLDVLEKTLRSQMCEGIFQTPWRKPDRSNKTYCSQHNGALERTKGRWCGLPDWQVKFNSVLVTCMKSITKHTMCAWLKWGWWYFFRALEEPLHSFEWKRGENRCFQGVCTASLPWRERVCVLLRPLLPKHRQWSFCSAVGNRHF